MLSLTADKDVLKHLCGKPVGIGVVSRTVIARKNLVLAHPVFTSVAKRMGSNPLAQ